MLRYTHCPRTGRRGDGANNNIILCRVCRAMRHCAVVRYAGHLPAAGRSVAAGGSGAAGVLRVCCGRIRLSLCFRRFDYGVERHSKAFVSTSDSRRFLSPAPPQPARPDAETVGIPHVAEPAGGGAGRFMGRGRTFVWFPMKKNMRFFCLNSKFIIFAYVKL